MIVVPMKKGMQMGGLIIFFAIIFMMVVMWKIDTNSEMKRPTTKTKNDAVFKGIDGYIA